MKQEYVNDIELSAALMNHHITVIMLNTQKRNSQNLFCDM